MPARPRRRGLVVVQGMSLAGERDPRLVRLARSFAAAGFSVAAPALPGLKSCREDVRDLSSVQEAVAALRAACGGPVGVVAFSFGAGVALTAVADGSMRGTADPILLMGPYHSLEDLWRSWPDRESEPRTDAEWDDFIYIRMALAWRMRDDLPLSPSERERLGEILLGYCDAPAVETKRGFYREVLRRPEIRSGLRRAPDPETLRALSPCGKLSRLRSRVMIVHDLHDGTIPCSHSEKIFAELKARRPVGEQRLLVTPILSHVEARSLWRIDHAIRIADMFGEFWGSECAAGERA